MVLGVIVQGICIHLVRLSPLLQNTLLFQVAILCVNYLTCSHHSVSVLSILCIGYLTMSLSSSQSLVDLQIQKGNIPYNSMYQDRCL